MSIKAITSISVSNTSEAYKSATNYIEKEDSKVIFGDINNPNINKKVSVDEDSVDIMDGDRVLSTFSAEVIDGESYGAVTNQDNMYFGSKIDKPAEKSDSMAGVITETGIYDYEDDDGNNWHASNGSAQLRAESINYNDRGEKPNVIDTMVFEHDDDTYTKVIYELPYIQPIVSTEDITAYRKVGSSIDKSISYVRAVTIITGSVVDIHTPALKINGVCGYSTEPYPTGKRWIDGRAIWSQDIYYKKTTSAETTVLANFISKNNVDIVTYWHAHCNDANGRTYPNTYEGGSNSSFNCRINDAGSIVAVAGSTYPSKPFHVVVKVEFVRKEG